MWWRVECRKDGSLASCQMAEGSVREGGNRVFYVEAEDAASAASQAVARYQRYLKNQRESVQSRREERKANGLCTECGEPAPNGQRNCNPCLARHRMVVKGTLPEGARQGKVTPRVKEIRLIRAGRSQRAAILAEILEAAISMKAGVRFISWLRAERDAAESGKAVAAE